MEGVMKLTKSERMEQLQRQASARNGRADSARHARLILLLSEGLTWAEIRVKLDCADSYISRWSKRFETDRLAGLYFRHSTVSLYAAFNTKTGEVLGKTAERHTSAEFVAFLTDIVVNQPRGKEIHVIADNLSAHKTKRVDEFLSAHANVHLHFTPTYSSWLNQVELWFAKIERDVIARGVFSSVPDLKRKLMRYIRQYNKEAKPVKWKYFDSTRRITPESIVTVH